MEHRRCCTTVLAIGAAGMMSLALPGCATSGQGEAETSPTAGAESEVTFPEPGDAWLEQGTYVSIENLRKMQAGVSKDQIYDLLGRPHFSEGLFGVRKWNYIFHLPAGYGGYMTCQYQVQFDDAMLAESLHWRESRCAALLEPRADEPTRMSLAADTLFDFDSAQLSPEGQRQVDELAERIRNDFVDPEVMVVGHTDRLGSDAYNQALSERRATTVRSALIDNGLEPMVIQSRGLGERQPVTRCEGSRGTLGLKECLQPNRRVDIEVKGGQR
ncbi:OmpA family protein [Halomonas sabkhae]|uniref:OmpA family protein n=1 Tax=Halomonas sabkhae TaxID=626223 RepID=UPI0025B40C11|nr:OmpA family protein [Halomonas sabkhae]MDN3526239.1 OmpA family protein [Halomonas sabkhae]